MKPLDILHETYSALVANKVRTGLTMLGIIIGISSVIAMVSIGQGAQATIQASIQSIGSNLIMVSPGAQATAGGYQVRSAGGSIKTLTYEDAQAIAASISGAQSVTAELSGRYQVVAKGTNTNTTVDGTTPTYPDVRNIKMAEGDFISDLQLKALSKVAVLGPTARDSLFGVGATDVVGNTLRINGMEFVVIGVTTAKGSSGFGSADDTIFVPLTSAQQFLAGSKHVSSISVQAVDSTVMAQAQLDVTDLLLKRHKIVDSTEADFSIMNQNDIVATASSVTGIFTILLGAVAGISLVVGGIGIMNMMLTTVTERTREIGLRKAIGAKKKDISRQFLFEAVALTVVGGTIGVLLGWAISFAITYLNIIATSISFGSVALAFGVSAFIGIVFGYYPAKRAAELNPIEALRYE
ncbi:MAG: ABC transporter permease [Candidatus Paceibacterota bacterium]|jgi:putative ABC transport system permease protein